MGDSLWQVHSVAFPANQAPTPKFYEFNTADNTVKQSGYFFADSFSDDWNASIGADVTNTRTFVTWSSTDVLQGISAQVRFGGCSPSANCAIGTGDVEFTSNAFWTFVRWGDYSAITIDPTDPDGAFLVNEYLIDNVTWGSRLAQLHF